MLVIRRGEIPELKKLETIMRLFLLVATPLCLIALVAPSRAKAPVSVPSALLTYADVADLALASELVAEVRIAKAERIENKLIPSPVGVRRLLISASVTALIRGLEGLSPRITYLANDRTDSRGKFARLEKAAMIIFAVPVLNKPSEVRLVAVDAQQRAAPTVTALVRSILVEANMPASAPRILRVGDAFHVPGSVPGEGETQIFLAADDGRPLSLSVWRQPGAAPRWAVSLGEIVDEGAAPPKRDTLLWYRLACFLPRTLPPASVDSLDVSAAAIATEDYATVIAGLGACPRTRNP
jgi:hypothetical protein